MGSKSSVTCKCLNGIRGSAPVVRMSVMAPRSGDPSTSARMSKSRVETTLIVIFDHRGFVSKPSVEMTLVVFFDHRGFVHRHCVLEVHHSRPALLLGRPGSLGRLISRVRCTKWSFWEAKNWALHHDNAPAHSAISVQQVVAEKQVAVLKHPPICQTSLPVTFGCSLK